MEAKLWEDWLREEGNHRVVLFLFLNDFVEHAGIIIVISTGKDVLKFNFARFETGFWLVAIGKHAEVKDRGAIVRFDQNRNVADT